MNIFLAYASEDKDVAEQIYLVLLAARHHVFFDSSDLPPGADYNTRIRKAVDACELFIFLVSPDSVAKSSYALTELGYAREKWQLPAGYVLPVLVRQTDYASIPNYLKAVTILEPEGNTAAAVGNSVADWRRRYPRGLWAVRRIPIPVAVVVVLTVILVSAQIANRGEMFDAPSERRPTEVAAQETPGQVPTSDEVSVDFASVDTATAPGRYVAADPYLLDYEILVSDLVPSQSKVVLINNLALYRGQSVRPTTAQNFLTQIDTHNTPASFKLMLKRPCQTVSFVRPKLIVASKSGITHPAWSAHAFDEEGRELSSQREDLTRSHVHVPARTYVLSAPGPGRIAAVRFDSDPRLDGKPFSAFSSILIEQLTIRCSSGR
jgi:hypothetical protein